MKERRLVPRAEPTSYYGRPVLKRPVWTWEVPTYFFVGGMAGAASPLATAARLAGNHALARRASLVALAGIGVSPLLLISDLGRPERFYRMLRVFKPTSPMSVGTWMVSLFGGATALATPWHLVGLPGAGKPAGVLAAFAGPAVSTYTAVLIAQTSVPAWHEARRELPFVFAGSSMASAGGATAALTPPRHAAPARALALGGAALELVADHAMTRRPNVRSAYDQPTHRAARACTVLGAALMAGRRARAGGLALCAGSALQRLAVIRAGRISAADPAATIGPQRERL
ncbi:MAG: hypothetical protein QOI80_3262 [Solirubrobacteraceae bacterium]|nr:hypothetical protein [Solirubrobacteraceae bacterium]